MSLQLYYLKNDLDDLSCADKKCSWKSEQKKALENYEPAPLLNHECLKKIKLDGDTSIKISKLQETEINNVIIRKLPNCAVVQHISGRHSPVVFNAKSKVSDEEKIAIETLFRLQDNPTMEMFSHYKIDGLQSCCHNTLQNFVGDFITICIMTKDHYDCWQRERQFRITDSICYNLYTYTKNKKADWVKKTISTFNPKSFKSIFTEYGKKTENEARLKFIASTNVQVFVPGLIVSLLNSWLAYSPDGIIYDKGVPAGLLEIKCSYRGKVADIEQTVNSVIGKCLIRVGENIELKGNHQYFGQVQLGMIVVNVKMTYFVIYSSFDKNMFIIKVNQDLKFTEKMLIALKKVYYGKMLHTICVQQKSTNDGNDESTKA